MLVAASAVAILCTSTLGTWMARRGGSSAEAPVVAQANVEKTSIRTVDSSQQTPMPLPDFALPGGPRVDQNVKPATAVEPIASDLPADLVLPSTSALPSVDLRFRPGQRVRGRAGQRPRVSISGAGLRVDCEDVSFEGIDFVLERSANPRQANRAPPLLTIEAQATQFRGCSFSTTNDAEPIAIVWSGAAGAVPGASGELTFSDCVFQGMAAVVDCDGANGLTVEMTNTLCVASGPILRLGGCPKRGETFAISLDHATTRGDSAVLECRYTRLEEAPGQITITVADSALVTNPHGALVLFAGRQRPELLVRAITWNGQGSLVTPDSIVGLWRSRADKEEPLAEDAMEVGGLVRSEVEFAGEADGPPAASRITRWQAPLRSDDPPGANTDALFLPNP